MSNPFIVPQRYRGDKRPLCPWAHPEHDSYFVPVDHSEEAFQRFRNEVGDPRTSLQRPITVIVRGEEGCGKTALIHRCANWLNAELKKSMESLIVDLTEEDSLGLHSDARLAHWTDRLVDRLTISNFLVGDLQKALTDRRSDPLKALPFLGDVLEQSDRSLQVIFPAIELFPEAQRLAALSRRHLTIYTECRGVDLARQLSRSGLGSVVELEVGVLTVADGWRFVQARMQAAATALGPDAPAFSEATVNRYMNERIKGRGTTTIRELNLICAAVFEDASRNARAKIEFSDFSSYYLRNGVL